MITKEQLTGPDTICKLVTYMLHVHQPSHCFYKLPTELNLSILVYIMRKICIINALVYDPHIDTKGLVNI